jgi:hypothetical protein
MTICFLCAVDCSADLVEVAQLQLCRPCAFDLGHTKTPPPPCSLCAGETLRFRGRGVEAEAWCCPRWRQGGHLSAARIDERVAERRRQAMPSGRWA